MKIIALAIFMIFALNCMGQKKIYLNEIQFTEDEAAFVRDVPDVLRRNLFTRTDMFSLGVSKNATFYFKDYLPKHVELLSYKGQLTGYAFKIWTYEDEQKVKEYIVSKYKIIKPNQETPEVQSWRYADDKVVAEIKTVTKESFAKGMAGYVMVRRTDFDKEFNRLMDL